ncbi:uncharacterized protein LOC143229343 isoform X1 [Tachypleus tridentatus]|uniref:uncharacterized protein LOC143229343 isoform X1 n=1 Tax=Tachypleus tridentatus TaxID=6853 RepID=UPI003FD65AAC
MGSQQFCLKWNDHHSNVFSFFENLFFRGLFVDVTLVCEGMKIKAHKMVLSACSPLFQSIFEENPCKHPVIIMKDIKYVELNSVLDFMYHGEVNVSQDQLSGLLKTARTLKVRGLAVDGQDGAVVEEVVTQYQPQKQQLMHGLTPKRKRVKPCRRSGSDIASDDDATPVKIQETSSPEVSCLSDHSIDLSGGLPKKVYESCKTATQDTSGLCSTVNTETNSKSSHEESVAQEQKVEHATVLPCEESSTEPSVAGGSTFPLSMTSRVWEPETTQLSLPSSRPRHSYSSHSLETPAELMPGPYQLPDCSPMDGCLKKHSETYLERSQPDRNDLELVDNSENSRPENLTESEIGILLVRSHNVRQFAVNIARAIFSQEEMRTSNCRGAREFQQLDLGKLAFVRETVLRYYNISLQAAPEVWKLCCQSIDAHCRHERRLYKRAEASAYDIGTSSSITEVEETQAIPRENYS